MLFRSNLKADYDVIVMAAQNISRQSVLLHAPTAWLPTALSAVLLLVMLGMAAAAVACNWGPGAPGLPLFGLIVCVACAAVSVRTGLVLAGIGASLVGVVALWVPPGLAISAPPSMAMQLGTQWLGILSGLAAGVMISRTVARYVSAAQGREDRFSSLLALAADVYWELDENYHLVGTAQQGSALQRFPGPTGPAPSATNPSSPSEVTR